MEENGPISYINFKPRSSREAMWMDPDDFQFALVSCGNGPSTTLHELQKAIQTGDIMAVAACYTDPFHVTSGGETMMVSYAMGRIAYAFAFAWLDYSTWSLAEPDIAISGNEATVSCM